MVFYILLYVIEKYGNEIIETKCLNNLAITYIRAFPQPNYHTAIYD